MSDPRAPNAGAMAVRVYAYGQLAFKGRFSIPISIPVARTFALEDTRDALEISLAGRTRGKLVLVPLQ